MPRLSQKAYYETVVDAKSSPLLQNALRYIPVGSKGRAIDLGCGSGRDTKLLLEKEFSVTAVDEQDVRKYLDHLSYSKKLTFTQSRFEELELDKSHYILANASWSLPFVAPADFPLLFAKVTDSLKDGGIFCGQLFGVRDGWNVPSRNKNTTFLEDQEVTQLLKKVKVLHNKEYEIEGHLASGAPKHWHYYDIIIQK
jgi:tellurite methyltransferase